MNQDSSIWLAQPTRFHGLSRTRAWAAFALLLVLLALSLTAVSRPGPAPVSHNPARRGQDRADILLYERIVDGVRHGGGYYQVAANALRAGHYPLRPFVAFREPTLALAEADLPQPVTVGLLYLLVAANFIAWTGLLRRGVRRSVPVVVGMALLAGGLMAFVQPNLWSFHEVWAGLLISLSLALHRPNHWRSSVALGLAAMLVRETAALYVLVMAGAALAEGRWRETLGWAATLAIFTAVMGMHAWAVHNVTSPNDPASPGWTGLQGPGFFALAVVATTALHVLPLWLAVMLAGLSLFGWLAWRDPLGARVTAVMIAYGLLLSCFARVDNFYWALLVAPTALVGLLFVPDAIRDAAHAALDKKPASVRG